MSIKSGAKAKNQGVAGWKVGQTWYRNDCSHAKKYNKNTETLLAQQNFSLRIWEGQLKFMLQHPTVRFDSKNRNIWANNCFCMIFCIRGTTDVWKTVTNSACRPLYQINLWKIFAGHTGDWFDVKAASILYHWSLERSEKFHFDQFEN